MKTSLSISCAAMLVAATAFAQDSINQAVINRDSSTDDNTNAAKTVRSTTATSMSGRVIDYTPGTSITLDDGSGSTARFAVSDKVEVIGPAGNILAPTQIQKNATLRAHLTQQGNRMIVDQVILDKAPR
jgi:hypothetical protein